jgi:hypothetical protein
MMQRTTAVLFQTHFFDRWCARAFARVAAGCPPSYRPVVLIHLPPGAPVPLLLQGVPHHVVRTPELRVREYPAKSGGPDWNLWEGGHTDLIFLHYVRAHPEHVRYWGIEYDVRFSGDWGRFFAAYEDDPSDFLAPAILPRALDPGWYNWASLGGPVPLPESEQLRAFLPVFGCYGACRGRCVSRGLGRPLRGNLAEPRAGFRPVVLRPGRRRAFYATALSRPLLFQHAAFGQPCARHLRVQAAALPNRPAPGHALAPGEALLLA